MNTKISLLSLLLFMGSMSVNAQSNTALKTEANNSMRKPVVSLEKVRVLYVGLDNELAIMADCIAGDPIQVTTDNGTIAKSANGMYVAKPENPGAANVLVEVKGQKYSYEFRVKYVPDPVPKVGNSSGGRIPANVFKSQMGLRAELENFDFTGIEYEVVGYTFYVTDEGAFKDNPGIRVVSNARGSFEPVKDLIAKCQPGTTIVIDEIKVKGPDDQYRKLPTIAFNLY